MFNKQEQIPNKNQVINNYVQPQTPIQNIVQAQPRMYSSTQNPQYVTSKQVTTMPIYSSANINNQQTNITG